jgi:hypothetical protein
LWYSLFSYIYFLGDIFNEKYGFGYFGDHLRDGRKHWLSTFLFSPSLGTQSSRVEHGNQENH